MTTEATIRRLLTGSDMQGLHEANLTVAVIGYVLGPIDPGMVDRLHTAAQAVRDELDRRQR